MLAISGSRCGAQGGLNSFSIDFAVSPNEKYVVFTGSGRAFKDAGKNATDLYLYDVSTGRVRRLTDSDDIELEPAISPDGKQIVYSVMGHDYTGHIYVCGMDGGSRKAVSPEANASDRYPMFLPNGRDIVFMRAARHREYSQGGMTWDYYDMFKAALNGTPARRVTRERYYDMLRPWPTTDGRSVAYSATPLFINGKPTPQVETFHSYLASLRSGKTREIGQKGACYAVLSPDGGRIACTVNAITIWRNKLTLMDVHGGQQITLVSDRDCRSPQFSADGERIYYLGDHEHGGYPDLSVVDIKTRRVRTVIPYSTFLNPSGEKSGAGQ